ncbi:hypothetical protein [uncultured Megasphaera sp.]|uniref:hypothetical protein n=1 Tax=uncultured Megasphaera sp. TaxID=165188 RepID=UPI002598C050|nr:hypothetical protein [uncultured Megasphaera sp.]
MEQLYSIFGLNAIDPDKLPSLFPAATARIAAKVPAMPMAFGYLPVATARRQASVCRCRLQKYLLLRERPAIRMLIITYYANTLYLPSVYIFLYVISATCIISKTPTVIRFPFGPAGRKFLNYAV